MSPTRFSRCLLLCCLAAPPLLACSGSIGGGVNPPNGEGAPAGGGPSSPGQGMPPGGVAAPPAGCAFPPRRIWALTPEQYLRTVRSLLPIGGNVGDGLAASLAVQDGFSNEAGRLDMTEPHVAQLLDLAWQVAGEAAATPAMLSACLATGAEACVRDFAASFGQRAFRRELAPAEIDALMTHYQAQQGDAQLALRELLMDILISPNTLYRTEMGPEGASAGGSVVLTPFEKASALSYFLTDGPPDAELLTAARTGALASAAQIEQHTRRMLRGPDSASGLLKFLRESYGTRNVLATTKDTKRFPEWKAPLPDDLASEAEGFLRQVLWSEDARLETLLTASFSMLNGRLAAFYGVADPGSGQDLRKVSFQPGQRAGLMTQAAMMAVLSKDNDTDVVGRGKFVREVLLCQTLPPPPVTVNAVPPPPDGKRTQRERMAMHSADPSCAGCHALMDPLGLAFERYDGIGRWRTTDVGQNLDTSGRLTAAQPDQAPFSDAVGLMGLLARSPDVARCFVAAAFRYAHGRAAESVDKCALDRLGQRFDTSHGNVIDLAVALTTDEAFFVRAGTP
jgi:hypothetical protein